MARGSKASYSSKQKRQAAKIEKSAKKRGHSTKRAEQIAWATVNKQDGGAKGKSKKASSKKKSTSKKSTAKKKSTSKKGAAKKRTTKKKATRKKS